MGFADIPIELRAIEPLVTLTEAMTNDEMMGRTFGAPSFWTWRVLSKLVDGLPLSEPRERELYEQATGCKYRYVSHGYNKLRRLILLAGRRAGKDRWLSGVAVWRACLAADWRKHVSAGEGAVVILLGKDKRQSNILRKYCAGLLKVPLLAAEVVRHTDEMIEFRNGATLEITTSAYDLVRGRSAIAVLGSEVSFWNANEASPNNDAEIVGAAEDSMGMSPAGPLLLLGSSVYRQKGFMFEQYQKLHGNPDGNGLCWFTPSKVMNPRLPQAIIDAAIADRPSRGRAEYENIWRADSESYIGIEVLEECTDWGIAERPSEPGKHYIAYFDAATGAPDGDSATISIGHQQYVPDAVPELIMDVMRERRPQFVLGDTIEAWAQLLKQYRINTIVGDQFAFKICKDMWQAHGITLIKCENSTSDNYIGALPLLLQKGRVRLLDNETCRRQFASLVCKIAGGHEAVEHPKTRGAHDDVATSVAGCLMIMASTKPPLSQLLTPEVMTNIYNNSGAAPVGGWRQYGAERAAAAAARGFLGDGLGDYGRGQRGMTNCQLDRERRGF
jgi:hypothetical protein